MTIEEAKILIDRSELIAVAESCTGGLIAAQLTEFPGSTAFVWGGFLVYDNLAKEKLLGVQSTTINNFGAVSEYTLKEMLQGVLNRTPATWALAVTGIAGPAGGSPEKPAGTVWIGVQRRGGTAVTRKEQFTGDRQMVRGSSVESILDLLFSQL
jgi:nicotinamide-nucleotide amidase